MSGIGEQNLMILKKMNTDRKFEIAISILVFAVVVFFVMQFFIAALQSPYPREYRDVANVQMTQNIIEGKNPYVLHENADEQSIYVYTPLNSLVIAGIYAVTHINIVFLHYFMDAFYIILSAVLMGIYVFRRNRNIAVSLLTILLGLCAGYRLGYVSAIPDHLGVFISVILLLIVSSKNIGHKRIIWSVFLSVLLFYAKQYFVVLFIPIAIYFFFQSRKDAIIYVLGCTITGLLSLYLINIWFPLFSINVLYFFGCHTDAELDYSANIIYSIRQFQKILIIFSPEVIICLVNLISKIRKKEKISDENLLWVIIVVVMFPTLFVLGKNQGAYLSYHLQLMVPSLIVLSMSILSGLDAKIIWKEICIVCTFLFSIYGLMQLGQVAINTNSENQEWQNVYSYLDDEHQNGELLILAPQLGYYALEHNLDLQNNGHDYLSLMNRSDFKEGILINILDTMKLIPERNTLKKLAFNREQNMMKKINEHFYSAIITSVDTYPDLLEETMNDNNYIFDRSITLRTGNQMMDINIYTYPF